MTVSPVIQVNDLWFRYGPDQWILSDLNLTIAPGEFVALIGQNGAGKTTLVKHFNGILHPTRGSVLVNGRDTREILFGEAAYSVGYVYQNPDHQIFNLTVREELEFGPRNLGLDPEEIERRTRQVLETVGLVGLEDEYPFALSRGQRQKLAVGAILTMNPPVIIIDEPTTGMDWQGSVDMLDLIQDLHKQGRTIVMITHDMRIVATYARRVTVMAQGQILADGTPADVFSRPDILEASFLQPPQITRIAQGLAAWGMRSDILSVEEAVEHFKKLLVWAGSRGTPV
ncbi:MAG: energy-coupling factor ABC transporter ATP-binding protein [Ardenticatenaceae bacterium]|nr:energy-coupling factor ABC transporter ATP-binding protein [Ardenticatenaceae bacterium]HBY97332.1 energy-coupling factor ABC transporter ATP-binding protein [Chloroflexota bacterium]